MGYIGRGPVKSGAFRIIDDFASSFNGSTTAFTLQSSSSNITPGTEQNLLIAVDGVVQEPQSAFTISGSTITFTSAPASGASFWGVELGDVGGIASSVANGTVDTAQLAADAVDGTKIADNAIDSEHYIDGSIDSAHIANDQIDSQHYAAGSIDLEHMSSQSVDEDNLHISNAGSNGEFLSKQSGNAGGLTWAAASPQDISVRVTHNAAQGISHGSTTVLAFNSELFDTDGMHDNSTNNSRLTCKTAGKYLIGHSGAFAANASGQRNNQIYLNNTTVIAIVEYGAHSAGRNGMQVTTIYDLDVDDYVEVRVYQNSGGSLDYQYAANEMPWFWMVRI